MTTSNDYIYSLHHLIVDLPVLKSGFHQIGHGLCGIVDKGREIQSIDHIFSVYKSDDIADCIGRPRAAPAQQVVGASAAVGATVHPAQQSAMLETDAGQEDVRVLVTEHTATKRIEVESGHRKQYSPHIEVRIVESEHHHIRVKIRELSHADVGTARLTGFLLKAHIEEAC